jgi:hypothetical protein
LILLVPSKYLEERTDRTGTIYRSAGFHELRHGFPASARSTGIGSAASKLRPEEASAAIPARVRGFLLCFCMARASHWSEWPEESTKAVSEMGAADIEYDIRGCAEAIQRLTPVDMALFVRMLSAHAGATERCVGELEHAVRQHRPTISATPTARRAG